MSRSGYTDEIDDQWRYIRWRGAVTSAIRGSRGQKLLRELADAMDAMESKRLISNELECGGDYCALGVVGKVRGLSLDKIDPECPMQVASEFDIARALAQEIVYENDEAAWYNETPEQRWQRMRRWVDANLSGAILLKEEDA